MPNYDALLFVSFGGPEKPEDVMPFLENVTRGRGVPRERLESVAEHYQHFGGKSPINEQNRALISALETELREHGIELPIYFGNRNWGPFLADAVHDMKAAGVQRALAFITSAYSSYSGCRQYLGDLEQARAAVPGAPSIEPLRRFFNHPGFIDAYADRLSSARAELGKAIGEKLPEARIVFTAHSIPCSMASSSDYEKQLRANAALLAERVGHSRWDLVWQSRSGPPEVPWLEPDILDHVRALAAERVPGIVIAPIGFLSDHIEVLYDLDEEARALCAELRVPMVRAATLGTHPRFVQMIRELVIERMRGLPLQSTGPLPPCPHVCAPGCCPRPERPGAASPRR
jgi:protoporphyrin/coproporphyrin ferrochelatase